jgi:starvation-inducible DNA-binding protein
MTASLDTAPDTSRLCAVSALQPLVPELVALSLDAKQAHWNMTGAGFLPLHALTDEIAADARSWTDRVAERVAALGFPVDARPGPVAGVAGPFPAGHIADHEVISELCAGLDRITNSTREALVALEATDPVGHGITVDIAEGLEKYRWMLRAQMS